MIRLTILFLVFRVSSAIIDENLITELPTVKCAEDAITFNIRTKTPFRGSIYVQDQYIIEGCRHIFHANELGQATFTVRLGDCGMRRTRQLNPYGMTYSLVFVTTFLPDFVTKADRAFNVKCFYEHADKMVNANVDVSGIPTEELVQSTIVLPACHYSIREGSLEGHKVRVVKIGQRIVHRWECDNPRYGMLVKNCFIADGVGGPSVKVIDERGCPTSFELGPIEITYDKSFPSAYTVMEMFQFPDKSKLIFQCQISVCDKEGNDCSDFTPPSCQRDSKDVFRPSPTQIVAIFKGAVLSNNIGQTLIDGTLTPTINDNSITRGHTDNHPPWQHDQNNMDYEETNEIKQSSQAFAQRNNRNVTMAPQTTTSTLEYQPSLIMNEDVTKPSKQLEIFVKSSSPLTTTEPMRQRDSRQRRLADQVIDVETDMIYIQPKDEISPSYAEASTFNNASTLTCLDQTAVVAIAVLFSVATLLSLLFITYLCRDMFRICGRDQEELCVNTVSSNASESGNTTNPIYIRRLGNPNYVLPF